ncbi:MAG TPA: class I SAM-dependent DNA methyltransferase, partial [Chloroflexota bacterium]|nr:class I SAM-dependent DNA methyltransferase [Chloroflexota bacterium]
MEGFGDKVGFIWSVADLLRGDYKPSEYGRVILPLVTLRRLDCVLAPTKEAVLAQDGAWKAGGRTTPEAVLQRVAKQQFYNTSKLDFPKLLADPAQIAGSLRAYINGFSTQTRETFEKFQFEEHIVRLERANLLYRVLQRFAEIDLHPDKVSNLVMGAIYEELIRRFSEQANETAGEHFTPREVIRLMVDLLFLEDDDLLRQPGIVRTLYDPAAGTGGMLSEADGYLRELNPAARLEVFGQELNDETFAICQSDLMLKGYDPAHITSGNSFTRDGLPADQRFDYCLSNPPYGVEWKKVEDEIRSEYQALGHDGRFGAGLPRINDGSFLFLQHMISKWKPVEEGGSRLAIIFNGSPLFTGGAGSGESEIRRWIIEHDWLEAIVALPDQLFYNTGINTYIWVLTNRKQAKRRGKVQLVNAVSFFQKMRKSLGQKRNEISLAQIEEIVRLYGYFTDGPYSKIFANQDFGYRHVTVERPLRVRYALIEETLSAVLADKAVRKFLAPPAPTGQLLLDPAQNHTEARLVAALRAAASTPTTDERAVGKALDAALREAG